jgi:uncharacterized protein (DUF2252 family)
VVGEHLGRAGGGPDPARDVREVLDEVVAADLGVTGHVHWAMMSERTATSPRTEENAAAMVILHSNWTSAEDAREQGHALREKVALGAHAAFERPAKRPTIAEFIEQRNVGRMEELLPIGHGRMAASAFSFYRGSAGLMAHDLAECTVTGIDAQICGDAHAANFGLYGTHDGRIIIDVNDFDETVVGPWEWDLKRLATSLVLAGRTGKAVGDDASRKAAFDTARAYRKAWKHLAKMPFVDSWAALGDESAIARADADALFDDFREAVSDAAANTSEKVARKNTERLPDGSWRFVAKPPVLTPVSEETKQAVLDALPAYYGTLRRSFQQLATRYRPRDVAMRVVGTGSVGMRAYVVLMEGNDGEALILQVKQAGPSALAPYLPAPEVEQGHAERIVLGARRVQAETDQLFGWADVAGTPYIVRQFRNRKGSIDASLLTADHLDDYGRLAGALLARAHSRSVDPRVMHGYLRKGKEFDEAIADFAIAYTDQVESDHAEMLELIESGAIEAVPDNR